MVIGLLLVMFLGGCGVEEIPLIQSYEDEWQLDVASHYIEGAGLPVLRPVVLDMKVLDDGSLLMIFAKLSGANQLGDLFVVKVSTTGEIVKDVALPTGYVVVDIVNNQQGGFTLFISDDYLLPDFLKVEVSEELEISQSSFSFIRPGTFHTLDFTAREVYLSQYEGNFPGSRIIKSNLEGQTLWNRSYNSRYLKPFPLLVGSQLIFFTDNYEDSVAVSAVNQNNGLLSWSRPYSYQDVFGVDIGSGQYRIVDEQVFLYSYDPASFTLYFSKVNPENGAIAYRKSSGLNLDQSNWAVGLADPTQDGGFLLLAWNSDRTFLFKTDGAGTVGWQGQFSGVAGGRALETKSGDLYFVSDGYVFRLKAVR